MKKMSPLLFGTILLTVSGLLSRFLGFFYRIWLARVIGETSLGLFQMMFPVFGLALSFCTSGIQTAISRFTAESTAAGDRHRGLNILRTGLASSLVLSILAGLLLYHEADFLARRILQAPECAALLPLLALMLPFASVHACISGYYLGRKNAVVSAGSQLTEQCVRLLVTGIAYGIFLQIRLAPGALLPVIGMVGGEAASFLFVVCALAVTVHSRKPEGVFKASAGRSSLLPSLSSLRRYRQIFRKLSAVACPITMQRMLTGALGSLEAVMLPLMLQRSGLSRDAALGLYGIFTGMVMPCILFPSAVTNSMSSMLMPVVAEANAGNDRLRLEATVKKTAAFSAAAGTACFLLFLVFGNMIGRYLLGNETAGDYLCVLAWLCPFLYLNGTLAGILNGLGRSGLLFLISILCAGIRLACVPVLVPSMGMHGHLLGLLVSTILQTFLGAWAVRRSLYPGKEPGNR